MTMTVKLPAQMEAALRQRIALLGKPASVLMREALQAWLDAAPPPAHSAYDAGRDLFGRHAGPVDLADTRKQGFVDAIAEQHERRSPSPIDAKSRRC